MNAWRAPKRIFLAHAAHEIAQFTIDHGAPAWIARLPAPPRTKTHTMPANDGRKTNDRDGIADIREKSMESDEDRPIQSVWPDSFRQLTAQNIELMAENNHLRFKSSPRHKIMSQHPDQKFEDHNHRQ